MYPSQPLSPSSAISSFVTYAKAIEGLDKKAFPTEYARNSDLIRGLVPCLRAHGILDVMEIRNPEIAALVAH
ncbi:hypothetical protein [Nocardia camponoti]|uniref:Uncharacterized protein n=1 Tax=Nocardia camponoti TaxID=1616106 RepID=A0A917VER0_9NOCA|nr:hypothetical protein [Nocardia camponoti]GGK68249.1 hypothetical protein GCM10011591_45430 [Nocardia camponoti]